MDHPRDDFCNAEGGKAVFEPEAEDESDFGKIPLDLLWWMFRCWDPSMRNATIRVCRRWNRVGLSAFDVFRTNQAFLYGMFLDSKHLKRLLRDSRLPRVYLEDPNILSVMFSRVSDRSALRDLCTMAIRNDQTWMTCFESAVNASNTSAVERLLQHPQSEAGSRSIDEVAQAVLTKQDAITFNAICKRYPSQLDSLLRDPDVTTWCCHHAYTVSLSEMLRMPAFCTPQNLVRVLMHALVNHVEALVFAVWDKGILSARESGSGTLLKACAHNWVRVASLLMRQVRLLYFLMSCYSRITSKGFQPADRGWNMAVHTAATYGHADVLRLLCSDQRSAPGTSRNRIARTALFYHHAEAAACQIADPRVAPDDDGEDATRNLMCLAMACQHPVTAEDKARLVKMLLDRGADPNRHDRKAIRMALQQECIPVLDVLVRCPRTIVSRTEFYAVLALVPRIDAHRELLRELLQSSRFRDNFM